MKNVAWLVVLIVLWGFTAAGGASHDAWAQEITPRFGVGISAQPSLSDIVGLGIRTRVSAPMNADFSLAADVGFISFLLKGRDDAVYVFNPQVSGIVTLPYQTDRAPYILAGIGAYVPFENDPDDDKMRGPTVHVGVGWVQTLVEATLFYEVDPSLVIDESSVGLALPFRVGIIF